MKSNNHYCSFSLETYCIYSFLITLIFPLIVKYVSVQPILTIFDKVFIQIQTNIKQTNSPTIIQCYYVVGAASLFPKIKISSMFHDVTIYSTTNCPISWWINNISLIECKCLHVFSKQLGVIKINLQHEFPYNNPEYVKNLSIK